MIGILNKTISKLFGSKSDKDVKDLSSVVDRTNEQTKKITSLDSDALRNKTAGFKKHLADALSETHEKINELQKKQKTTTHFPLKKRKIYTTRSTG